MKLVLTQDTRKKMNMFLIDYGNWLQKTKRVTQFPTSKIHTHTGAKGSLLRIKAWNASSKVNSRKSRGTLLLTFLLNPKSNFFTFWYTLIMAFCLQHERKMSIWVPHSGLDASRFWILGINYHNLSTHHL